MAYHKYDFLFKLIIIGDYEVGKSCLLLRYVDDSFSTAHIPRDIVPFPKTKIINLEGKLIKLVIYDDFQPRFRITKTFFYNEQGIIFIYDVTDQSSFKNIRNYIQQVEVVLPNICRVLVGTKCDMPDRVVTEEEGKKLAFDFNMEFFETSAKTNKNVNELFNYIACQIFQSKQKRNYNYKFNRLNKFKNY